jgi:hypothetical protein
MDDDFIPHLDDQISPYIVEKTPTKTKAQVEEESLMSGVRQLINQY